MPCSRTEWRDFVLRLRRELAGRSPEAQEALLETLTPTIRRKLKTDYWWLARRKQLIPSLDTEHDTFLLCAGRGFGKNFAGSHWLLEQARQRPGARLALIGESAADVRDYMVEGPSGVLTLGGDFRPDYEPSKRRLTFPNGAVATTYSADKPDQLRGFSGEVIWWDEAAKARFVDEVWDQIQFTLREGTRPMLLVTTTPRPIKVIKEMVADPDVRVVTGSTYENESNLAPRFLRAIEKRYAGTRLGRQELKAEILDDVEGALWTLAQIEDLRVRWPQPRYDDDGEDQWPTLKRVLVAVDPSGTATGDECGIVVVGLGYDGLGYVIEDLSLQASPAGWARAVVKAYDDYQADRVVAETNFGADMVKTTLRSVDRSIPFTKVTASRGKLVRAEPVASLYEQERVRHVGAFAALETEMTTWTPDSRESPNRLDALVWGLTELMLDDKPQASGRAAMV